MVSSKTTVRSPSPDSPGMSEELLTSRSINLFNRLYWALLNICRFGSHESVCKPYQVGNVFLTSPSAKPAVARVVSWFTPSLVGELVSAGADGGAHRGAARPAGAGPPQCLQGTQTRHCNVLQTCTDVGVSALTQK